ncbi:MAG: CsbD family protein [Chloroflexota bacterium]|nr:CsbD family protein [Chloroflexota bacterium]
MSGRMDEVKGSVKDAVGRATGDEQLEAEGKTQKAAGKAERETKGAANQVAGNVKNAVGDATGNERVEVEGEAQRLKGKSQSAG